MAEPGAAISDGPRRRRRWPAVVIGIAIGLVILVIAFFLVDAQIRVVAENRIHDEIAENLPSTVKGNVDVQINGGSMIGQYLSGSYSDVELHAPHLKVNGIPVGVSIVANGVPTDLTKPVDELTGTFKVSESALNEFITIPGATSPLSLGSGTLTYTGKLKIFGFPIEYVVTVKPKADGNAVLLEPTDVKVTSGAFGLNLTKQVSALLGSKPASICVAQYLPKGASLTGVTVTPEAATVTIEAKNIVLSEQELATKGSCP